jgi:hypothetical protein
MLEKPDYPVFYSGLSGFCSFWNRNRDGARLKDLKIKDVLRPGKILEGDSQWRRIPSQKSKSQKPKGPVLEIGMSSFH